MGLDFILEALLPRRFEAVLFAVVGLFGAVGGGGTLLFTAL